MKPTDPEAYDWPTAGWITEDEIAEDAGFKLADLRPHIERLNRDIVNATRIISGTNAPDPPKVDTPVVAENEPFDLLPAWQKVWVDAYFEQGRRFLGWVQRWIVGVDQDTPLHDQEIPSKGTE